MISKNSEALGLEQKTFLTKKMYKRTELIPRGNTGSPLTEQSNLRNH